MPDYPARSRFLMLGSRTEPIADGTFIPIKDPVEVRIVEVELRREIQSLEKLFLVGEDGTEIGELKLLSTDADNKTWKGTFDTGIYILPAKEGTVLGIEAKMKDRGTDGGPDELLEVIKFKVWVSSTEEVASYQLVPTGAHYPKHQTVQGELTNVENLITETGTLLNQNNATLAEFRFSSDALDGVQVNIENLSFAVTAPDSVMVINWKLKAIDEESEYNCSKDLIGNVNCLNIPFDIGLVENQTTLQLIGDITLDPGESGHALDIDLLSAGHIGMNGSVWWSDGTGNYTWIDKEDPLALGAR